MATGNGELMHECFPKHSRMGTARMKKDKKMKKVGREAWKEKKETMFIQIKNIWYYNVYIHKLKLSINYSD